MSSSVYSRQTIGLCSRQECYILLSFEHQMFRSVWAEIVGLYLSSIVCAVVLLRAVTERIMLLKGTIVQISKAMNLVAELLIEAANQKENAETNSTTIKLLVHRYVRYVFVWCPDVIFSFIFRSSCGDPRCWIFI